MMLLQITRDLGAPLSAGLHIVLHLLETLPSLPANLAYQSNPPTMCGFVPEAYAQPWLGPFNLDPTYIPSLNSHRRAQDVLKEAILCSTKGNASATAITGPSTSISMTPQQMGRDVDVLPGKGLPVASSSAVQSPSKCKRTKSLSPRHPGCSSSSRSLGSGSHFSSSGSSGLSSGSKSNCGSHDGSPDGPEANAGEGSVQWQAASAGSIEVLSEDDTLDSANEADISQGSVSLMDISASDDEDT